MFIICLLAVFLCIMLPSCAKKSINKLNYTQADDSLKTYKKTLINGSVDERFDFSNQVNPDSLTQTPKANALSTNKQINNVNLAIYQAKLFDIPMPMQAVIQSDEINDNNNGISLYYVIPCHELSLIQFYQREMELFGWQHLIENFSKKEALLVFEKPNKICVISIRQTKDVRNNVLVSITSSFKDTGHSVE